MLVLPRFYVDGIEHANLIEPDDVPKVPADKCIDGGNRGQCDVPHIMNELIGKDAFAKQALGSNSRRVFF